MSYLDYKLTMEIQSAPYITGCSKEMTAVAVLSSVGNKEIGRWEIPIPPVTSEKSVREAFCSLYSRAVTSSWQDHRSSFYHSGDFVRVIKDSSLHGFPIGSIVRLEVMEDDGDRDLSWLAEGFTTAFNRIDKRWIGEDEFSSLILVKEEENR